MTKNSFNSQCVSVMSPSSAPTALVPQSSTASKPVGQNCHPLSSPLSITEEEQLVGQLHLTETPEEVVVIALV